MRRRKPVVSSGLALTGALVMACGSFGDAASSPGADAGLGADVAQPLADGATEDVGVVTDGGPDATSGAVVLVSGLSELGGVAATETTVYFSDRGAGILRSVPIAGGLIKDLHSTGKSPSSIVVTDTYVFWGDYGQKNVGRYTLADAGVATFVPATAKGPVALAAAANGIVVISEASGFGDVQQFSFSFAPGPAVLGQTNPFDVAVLDSDIYWTASSTQQVWKGMIGASTGTVIANGESGCEAIAVDADGVYWTRPADVRASLKSRPGGVAVSLATGQMSPFGLAADASGIYWMTADGKLRRAGRGETPPATLATGFMAAFSDQHVQTIALTSKYVVWITSDGQLLRIDK